MSETIIQIIFINTCTSNATTSFNKAEIIEDARKNRNTTKKKCEEWN